MTDSEFAPGEDARPPFAVAGVAENPSGGALRERIARIIDHEGYWERLDNLNSAIRLGLGDDDQHMELCHVRDDEIRGTAESLEKADEILAAIAKAEGRDQ